MKVTSVLLEETMVQTDTVSMMMDEEECEEESSCVYCDGEC